MKESAPKGTKGDLTITIEGSCTIREAETIKALFDKSLPQAQSLNVDCSNVTEVDLSFLQLLCAAHKTALTSRKRLSIPGGVPAAVKAAAKTAGFGRHRGCGLDRYEECLWVGV